MKFNPTLRIPVVAGGGTVTIPTTSPITQVHLYTSGSVTLAANVIVTFSGTPVNGTTVEIFCELTNLTIGAFDVTLFGENINKTILENTSVLIRATYSISTGKFIVTVFPDFEGTAFIQADHIASDAITTAKILDENVTLDKIADLTRGSMIVGDASDRPKEIDFKTSGAIGVGDGTDFNSVVVSGDVTINGSGVTAIGAGKVTPSMLSFSLSSYLEAELTLTTAQILALNGTPQTIIAAPGSGKYIEIISATSKMTFVSAAYATNTTLQLINDGATIAQLQDTAILLSTVNKISKFQDVTPATAGQTQILENTAIQLKVATGNPITGDSDITVLVQYRIVTLP